MGLVRRIEDDFNLRVECYPLNVTRPVEQVLDDALALGEVDRARLVAKLVESLDGEVDPDTEDAWASEIERRLARIDAGHAKLMSMDEAVAGLHRAARSR